MAKVRTTVMPLNNNEMAVRSFNEAIIKMAKLKVEWKETTGLGRIEEIQEVIRSLTDAMHQTQRGMM